MRIFIFLIILIFVGGCTSSGSKTSQTQNIDEDTDTTIDANKATESNIDRKKVPIISKTKVIECAKIENSISRLACYDQMAKSMGLTKTSKTTSGDLDKGQWLTNVSTNPINDSKTVVLILTAESGKSTYGKPVTLLLRCKSNTTEAYIAWNDYLGSEADVTTRIGDQQAHTRRWSISTNNESTFFPGNDISFIKNLIESNKFVAQVTPYDESPVTAVFDIKGLPKAIKPLRETCHW